MIICNSIQYGEREAYYGGHKETGMTTGTVIQGEQKCSSAVEEKTLKKAFMWQSGGSKKKEMDLKSELQLS